MVFAHIALDGIGHNVFHFAVWYDGAMGFVLLSGLVVGIVQQTTISRSGQRAGTLKAWKRARLVYIAHLTLCVLAFLIAATGVAGLFTFASVSEMGWWRALLATLTLQINPPKAAILSLYVILLLFTPVASWLLRRNLWWVLASISAVVFLAGHVWEDLATSPRQPGEFGEINVAAWQAMYFAAFFIGWNWKTVRGYLDKPAVWLLAMTITVAIVIYARTTAWRDQPILIRWAFGSGQMGPGTVLLAFAVIAALFPVVTWIDKKIPVITGIFARLGRRSLDNYIILAFVVLPMQTFAPYDRSTAAADLGAVLVLVTMWAWSRLRDHISTTKTAQQAISHLT